ncbi:hypothetical protein JL720_5230 [Aureococcus anophagefferens]|nr:hypothetical protein JL720_5230 [Aureococcus anophagefferens]
MGAGASSREAALSSPEKEPAKCRQPKLQSISFRRCDLHASSGGTYHHRGASEVAAGAASPLAADEAEAAGDDEDRRLDRRAAEAWAADAVLLGAAGRSLTRLDLSEGCVSDRVAVGLRTRRAARSVASLTDLDLSGGSSFAEGGCVGFRAASRSRTCCRRRWRRSRPCASPGTTSARSGAAAALRKHPCLARRAALLPRRRGVEASAGGPLARRAGPEPQLLQSRRLARDRGVTETPTAPSPRWTRCRSRRGSLIQRECRPGGALTAADVIDAAVALAGGLAGNGLTRLDLGRSSTARPSRHGPHPRRRGPRRRARRAGPRGAPGLEALALGVDRRDARSVARCSSSPRGAPDLPAFRFAFPLGLPEAEFVAGATANAEGAVYGAEIARTTHEPLADALAASRRRADDVKYGRREEAWNNVFFNEDDADDGADAKPRRSLRPRPTTS